MCVCGCVYCVCMHVCTTLTCIYYAYRYKICHIATFEKPPLCPQHATSVVDKNFRTSLLHSDLVKVNSKCSYWNFFPHSYALPVQMCSTSNYLVMKNV